MRSSLNALVAYSTTLDAYQLTPVPLWHLYLTSFFHNRVRDNHESFLSLILIFRQYFNVITESEKSLSNESIKEQSQSM